MTIQIKSIKQYTSGVLFVTLYKVVLTYESVDEAMIIITLKIHN